jgi:hypothetical protein
MTYDKLSRFIFPLRSYSNKKFLVIMAIVAAALILDISLDLLSDIVNLTRTSNILSTVLFVILVPIFGIGQYIILGFIKQKNIDVIEKTPGIKAMSRISALVYFVLTAILVLLVIQIITSSKYSSLILTVSSTINYALAVIIMGTFSVLFISWYKSSKNFIILMYSLAAIAVSSSMLLGAILTNAALLNLPPERNALSETSMYFFEDFILGNIQYLFAVSNAVNYFLLWISTALLLRHYSKKLGSIRFWVIMSIPIILFINQFVVVIPIVESLSANPNMDIIYVQVFGNILPGIIGGIVFGIPFWMISRTIGKGIVRDYMVIAAWGSIFLQFTTSAGITDGPYPPFGLFSVLLTAMSCYLILVGIYSSAISVSIDRRLRHSIRKHTEEEVRLLSDIGKARVEQDVEKKVLKIVKENSDDFFNRSGVHPSLTEENAKQYLEDILKELESKKLKFAD